MRYFLLFIIVVFFNASVSAADTQTKLDTKEHIKGLTLLTDRSRASGELRVYLKNTGEKPITVVTGNVSTMKNEQSIEIAPDRHVLIKEQKLIELKESLADYSVVTLNSGEVTYIKNISIMEKSGVVVYRVKGSWAKLHNVWGGKISATF